MSESPSAAPQSIEECLAAIASCGNSTAVDAARSLVQTVLGLHRTALSRMMELVQRHGGSDPSLLEALAQDDLISNLLLLHDLHPVDLGRRIATAIAEAAPRIAELGARIEGHTHSGGMVEVQLAGLETAPATMAAHMILEEVILKHAPDAKGFKLSGALPQRAPAHAQGHDQGQGQGQGLIHIRIPQAARCAQE